LSEIGDGTAVSQLEKAEQFYAMLSGHSVVFGRQNNVAATARGQKDSKHAGTHARTNTFDDRAP